MKLKGKQAECRRRSPNWEVQCAVYEPLKESGRNPSLRRFKIGLNKALENVLYGQILHWVMEVLDDFRGVYATSRFKDSITLIVKARERCRVGSDFGILTSAGVVNKFLRVKYVSLKKKIIMTSHPCH